MTDNSKWLVLTYNKDKRLGEKEKERVIDFLYHSLEEFGDPKDQITKAIEYAQEEIKSFGGFVRVIYDGEQILGTLVMNATGMDGYIPANILVYVAVSDAARGKGVGGELIRTSIADTTGGVALHVEPNNPALRLYQRLGFSNKYLEMRYSAEQ